jgi:hypothetical protein
MKFSSRQQQKACYESNGFGNKVDCKAASKNTTQKSLPKKVSKSKSKK